MRGIVLALMSVLVIALALSQQSSSATTALAASTVTATDFYVPSGSDPWGTTFDSSGNLWVAVPGCDPSPTCSATTPPGIIATYNPSTASWTTYQLPAGYAQPLFLAFDSSGNLWFPLPMGNSIGMLNPATRAVQQWTVPTANSGPWDIVIDHNGAIWFTEHYSNKIGRFDPSTSTFQEFATPATDSQPYGITVDAGNNIWFTENNSSVALIAEYTAGGSLLEYKIRNTTVSGLTPHLITVDPNGNVWWSEGFVGMIGELKISQASPGTNNGVTEYAYPSPCSSCGDHTSGIGVDSNGLVWFDDSLQSIYGSFPDSATGSFTEYNSPTAYSHPHDGLSVDSQNRIWFDEEFANKIAEAIQSTGPTSTPTTVPTATSTSTAGPTPTASVTATATPTPGSGSVLAQDTFQRPDQSFWGTASDGHLWGADANSNGAFSISSNSGLIANGSTNYSATLGPIATDAQVLFTGSMSSYSSTNLGAVLRFTDGNNWYKAYIDGSNLVVQKKVAGTATILGSVPFSASGGTSYSLRFQVIGSALSARVWPTGTPEPTGWMVTASDSTFSSGYSGIRSLVQNGVAATYTSFTASTPSTPTPTASPTATPTSTAAATFTPTATDTPDPSPTATDTPTSTPTASATNNPTPMATATSVPPTPTDTATPTPVPPSPTPISTPTPLPVQQLTNGGFESGLTGWTVAPSAKGAVSVESAVVYSGARALELNGKASNLYVRQDVKASSGTPVAFSAYANITSLSGSMSVVMEVVALDGSGNMLQTFNMATLSAVTNGWVQVTGSAVMPANTAAVRVQVRCPKFAGTAYVDDISVH